MLSAHEAVVDHLVRTANASTMGFRRSLESLLEEPDSLAWFRLIPDAYTIQNHYVVAYEVEDTNRVSANKLRQYATLWARLQEHDIDLVLTIIDIRGGTWEPNLPNVYYHS